MERTFDMKRIGHLEGNLKNVAGMNYDMCLHKCNELKSNDEASCKQSCYNEVIVPFNMIKHEARSPEQSLYK